LLYNRSFSWSFGVFLFEVFSLGGTPYVSVAERDVRNFLEDGNRLEQPTCADEKT
jgi:hypothetical protein